MAAYDDSYICLTDAFEACRSDIYYDYKASVITKNPDQFGFDFDDMQNKAMEEFFPHIFTTTQEGAAETIRDYFDAIRVLCENDPERYNFEGQDLAYLRDAFKESLLLAKDHLHENLAFRNINGDVREFYYQTAEFLDRTLEAL